jgi:hypothetical protein
MLPHGWAPHFGFAAQFELAVTPPVVMVEPLTLPPTATPPQSAWTVGGIGSDDCGTEDFRGGKK